MKKQEVVDLLKSISLRNRYREVNEIDLFATRLDRAEKALARGKTLTHDELVEEPDKWFK